MYEPERSVSPEPVQIYGRLHHMKGKTKVIKQTCDMDCPQFTIGRDPGSDIRIHALDVSRVQCKIEFDLLTGKATIQVLSKSGLKINKILLPLGTEHTLQDGDVISVAMRRFKFEYPNSSSGSALEAPWLPDSPAPARTAAGDRENFSPAQASPAKPSARFGSTRARNSTRLHLFPEHAASKEVKKVLSALAGGEDDGEEENVKKRDLGYLEIVREDDDPQIGIEEKILASPIKTQRVLRQSFATPQPAKKALKAPRTSLVARTKKTVRIQEASPIPEATSEHETPVPATPSQIPLPPSKDTPYVANNDSQRGSMQYDDEFDNSFASSDGPASPSPLDSRQGAFSTPTPKNKYLDLLAREENPSTPINNGGMAQSYETPSNVPLPASMNTPYAGQDHEEDSEDVEMEDVEDIQENQETEIPSTPPARSAFQVQMTSPEAETDENAAPAPTSPDRSEVDLRNLMPLTPKPRTGRNSLRRNLLLHSSQKVMEAQMMQRARMMQSSYSARGAQLVAPTPIRLAGGTPYKTALPSPGMTNYASSESDEEERDDPLIFEDASDHFDEDEDYEDVSGAYETDAEELKGEEEDDDEDEQEQEGDQVAPQTPQRSAHSTGGADSQSINSASLTPSIRRLINQEIAAAGDSSDEDVDRSLDFNPEDDSGDDLEKEIAAPQENDGDMKSSLAADAQVNGGDAGATEPETTPQPQTPAYRTLGQRFFTPQYEARKSARRQPRKSLCDEFGPPVKFQAVLATPIRQALTRMEVDNVETSEEEEEFQERQAESSEELENEGEEEQDQMATDSLSYKEEFQKAELERQQAAWEKRQEAQSSRRVLPAPPSNFETPQEGSDSFEMKVSETKMHPVLAARDATEISSDEEDISAEKNALSDLKSQLKALRRKSLHRNSVGPAGIPDRRATLGVPLPSTPQASSSKQLYPQSAAPAARFSNTIPKIESGPTDLPIRSTVSMREVNPVLADAVDMHMHDDEVDSMEDQPSDRAPDDEQGSTDGSDNPHDEQDEPFEGDHKTLEASTSVATNSMAKLKLENPPATPEYRGIKEMLSVKAMQTPKLGGIREMYAEPKVAQTPAMNGIKSMFAQPKSPHTPDMAGLKHMLARPAESSTPNFDGMQDVLYQPEEMQRTGGDLTEQTSTEPEVEMADEDVVTAAPADVAVPQESVEPVAPARRTRRAVVEPTPSTKATSSTSTAARRTRTKVADETPAEGSSRTIATPAEPVKRTRVRAAATTVEPALPAKTTRTAKPPARATRAKVSATPEVPDAQETKAEDEVDDDTIILVKPAVPGAIARRPVTSSKPPTVAVRKAAPLKTTTAPAQPSKEVSSETTTASKPKPRAVRATKASVKVEETLQQEDIEPPKRATRTRADLSAPTAASKAKAAGNATNDAGATTTTRRTPATRTRAAVQAPVVVEEAAAPKRVTRARK